ncbi:MAG: hypothetical protein WCG90_08150, partial [Chitinophagia bacterium]
MKRIIFLAALICSISLSAQRVYNIDGIAKRFSTALGIPVKAASFYNTSSDTAIIFLDPADTTAISFKYKGIVSKISANSLQKSDSLLGGYASWALLKKKIDSLGAVKINISDTLGMLNARISSIVLNNTGAIHTTPTTFTRSGGTWTGNQTLATQSAFTAFARGSGSGAPSFQSLDTTFIGNFSTKVRSLFTAGSNITISNGVISGAGSSMVYPSAGIAVSTGSAWAASKTGVNGRLTFWDGTNSISSSSTGLYDGTNLTINNGRISSYSVNNTPSFQLGRSGGSYTSWMGVDGNTNLSFYDNNASDTAIAFSIKLPFSGRGQIYTPYHVGTGNRLIYATSTGLFENASVTSPLFLSGGSLS